MRRYLIALLRLAVAPELRALERRLLVLEGLATASLGVRDAWRGHGNATYAEASAELDARATAFLDVDHRGRPL